MSEEPENSIGSAALLVALLGGGIGMPIGHVACVAMGTRPEAPIAVLIVGIIGPFIGIVPAFAFSIVLGRLYRENSLAAATSHRIFWMLLAFASSAIFSAVVVAWLGWITC